MATGTRMGEASLAPGEKLTFPPPLPPRTRRMEHAVRSLNDLRPTSTVIAVVATLDMNTVCQMAPSELPPEIRWAVQSLNDREWATVRREAMRAQRQFISAASGTHRWLRRDEPWLLADLL